jgi:transcriptional regulator with XRE-family HTH domain
MTEPPRERGKSIPLMGGNSGSDARQVIEGALHEQPAIGLRYPWMVSSQERDARNRRSLVNRLVWIRKSRNLHQSEVAARMGTSQSGVSEIEKNLKDPRLSTLQRYARALELELEVKISVGSWAFVTSWTNQSIDYQSTVREAHLDVEQPEIWKSMQEKRQDKIRPGGAPFEPRSRFFQLLQQGDDPFYTDRDAEMFAAMLPARTRRAG